VPRVATPSVSGAANFQQYFPTAKLGSGNYVDVWSGGPFFFGSGGHNGLNYFSIGIPTCIGCSATSKINGVVGISVAQAYMIDQKIDDGSPGTGWVTANSNFLENVGSSWAGDNPGVSITASPTTCYDGPAISLGHQNILCRKITDLASTAFCRSSFSERNFPGDSHPWEPRQRSSATTGSRLSALPTNPPGVGAGSAWSPTSAESSAASAIYRSPLSRSSAALSSASEVTMAGKGASATGESETMRPKRSS
jgi:hypothetical protein